LIYIDFTGEATWNIQLEGRVEFPSFTTNINFYVSPLESTYFSIIYVNSTCGSGNAPRKVRIIVTFPLTFKETPDGNISLYPIPAWLYIYIETTLFPNRMVCLVLINILGFSNTEDLIDLRNGKTRWRIPNPPRGLYLLHFKTEDISITKKLVLE
jgi:hypothetical protein